MRAIILLGINCGLGPADLGRLRWSNIQGEKLVYPRPKTGNAREGYLWKRTRKALERVRTLKHTAEALAREQDDALVFISRHRQSYYREWEVIKEGKVIGIRRSNAISLMFGRKVKRLNMDGVSFYRLRHTFKTLGKAAKDRDALNLAMGHKPNNVEQGYDHEQIPFRRVRRVALKVKAKLWPKPKRQEDASGQPTLRIVGDEPAATPEAA